MDALQEAIKKRDEFLEQNPHLKSFQDEIDNILDKCNESDRLAVVNMLMMKSMIELQKHTMSLNDII